MVELYTITVWSFSAFYNTRKVGARGCHRAAPVSRYQSCAWSAKSGRGVVRLAYKDAMYSAFDRDRFERRRDRNEIKIPARAYQSTFDTYIENDFKFGKNVTAELAGQAIELKTDVQFIATPEIKVEKFFAYENKAQEFLVSSPKAPVFIEAGIPVLQRYSQEKFEKPMAAEFVPTRADSNFASVEFVCATPVVPLQSFAIDKQQTIRREKIISLLNNVEVQKKVRAVEIGKIVPIVAQRRISTAPVLKKELRNVKAVPALNLQKVRVAKVSLKKGERIPPINVAKCAVKNQVLDKKAARVENKFVLPDIKQLKLPANPVPEYIVEKIVKKFEKLKRAEFDALKILDYSVSYAKEKQIALVKRSFNLWRILWARINGEWAMVIIDDVTKIIVGCGMFAKMQTGKAVGIINEAMRNYGTPQAVVNYEQVLFCSGDYCEKNPGERIEAYLERKGIEYLISIVDEGIAFVRGCEFLEHVQKRMESGSDLLAFVNMYNLKGIRGVGNGVPAFYYLQSE